MDMLLLGNGVSILIRFPDRLQYGSLRPIKRGGKKEYYCRECFADTQRKEDSVIPLKTPHWTQSVYLDGVTESRQPTRVCEKHAKEFLLRILSDDIKKSMSVSPEKFVETILSVKERIPLDTHSLQELYMLGKKKDE